MAQRIEIARPRPGHVPPHLPALPASATLTPAQVGRFASWRLLPTLNAEVMTLCLVLAIAAGHLLRVYDRGFNLLDEGFVLHVTERVMQGQVPYRDFFTQLTPGAFLALAAIFTVTGPSVMVGRWATLFLGLAITCLLYWGARRVVSRTSAALAALAFPVWGIGQGWFYPNYSWFALAAAAAALCCVLRAQEIAFSRGRVSAQTLGWLASAGFLCGLAAFCKQNIGLYAVTGLAAALLLAGPGSARERVLAAFTLGSASVPVPLALLIWLAFQGALADFARDAVWIPLKVFPQAMAAPYPALWPPWPLATDRPGQGEWAFRLVCLLPPLPYAASLFTLTWSAFLHRRAVHTVGRTALAPRATWLAFGLAMWVTAFPRADFDHVQVALGPAFVVGAVTLESAGRLALRRRIWRLWRAVPLALPAWIRADADWCARTVPSAVASTVLAGFIVAGLGHARLLHMGPSWTLRGIEGVAPRAAGLRLDHDDAAELNHLIREVRRLSQPGDHIAALPWNAGLYFLAERSNVTRFDLFIPASVLPDDMPEIERSLARADLIVYWTPRDPFVNNTSFDDRYPELHEFLLARFRFASAVNAYRLLVPAE